MDFSNILELIKNENFITLIIGAFSFFLYKKGNEFYQIGYTLIQKKVLITHSELLEHTFFKILKYNTLNNVFIHITKDSAKEDFKFYIANALNYITQYHYLKNFNQFIIDSTKFKTNEELNQELKKVLFNTEDEIDKQIKSIYGDKLFYIYEINTQVLRNFYLSLIMNITEYEQFKVNEKLYTILNTLMFITKTNENSLFQTFLKMNGDLEKLQKEINLPTKIELINNNL